ncbi:MAG: hypothetical protein FWH04_08780 [Oscillospiraceae bacterium]|nr:hypothetical protein [Oscillospiraceae bacterium]
MVKIKRAMVNIVATILLFASVTACNSIKSVFDNEPQGHQQEGDVQQKGQEDIHTPIPDEIQFPDKKEVPSDNILNVGDIVSEIDVENGKLIPDALAYTVEKATLFSGITEAGISQDALVHFVEGDVLDEDGNPKPGVRFVLVELAVKNKSALAERNITSFQLLSAEPGESATDSMNFFDLPYPAYFSNATRTGNGSEYYAYNLPVGQNKNLKVGWYVDTNEYDTSDLYLVFNRDVDEHEKFVKLDFQQEG